MHDHASAVTDRGLSDWAFKDDLDPAEILRHCRGRSVPANCTVEAAIAAHRQVFEAESTLTETGEIAGYTFCTVLLAATSTRPDAERQFSYLESLPLKAWPTWTDISLQELRTRTLAGLSKNLDCASKPS